jgi:hypothetical protein
MDWWFMSNRLHIIPTKFEDVRTGEVGYGWRAFDDYYNEYSNMWDSIPDDNLEFFDLVLADGCFSENEDALESAISYRGGLYIADIWYTSDHILPILAKHDAWRYLSDGN